MSARVTCDRHMGRGLLFGVVSYAVSDPVTYVHLGLWCVKIRRRVSGSER